MVSWCLGKTTALQRVAWRGLGGTKSSEGQAAAGMGGRCQARGTPSLFPLPFPCQLVSNPISVGSFGFSSIEVVELIAIEIKREESLRSVQDQSKSPHHPAAHRLLPLPQECLGPDP